MKGSRCGAPDFQHSQGRRPNAGTKKPQTLRAAAGPGHQFRHYIHFATEIRPVKQRRRSVSAVRLSHGVQAVRNIANRHCGTRAFIRLNSAHDTEAASRVAGNGVGMVYRLEVFKEASQ
jgi:hypothetical protein